MHLQILQKQIECEAKRNEKAYAELCLLAPNTAREWGVVRVATISVKSTEVPPDDDLLWQKECWRQQFAGTCHTDTETIYYRMPPILSPETLFNDLDALWRYNTPTWVSKIVAAVASHQNFKKLGRVMLVKLKPGGKVSPHIDQGLYARTFARYHAVIKADHFASFLRVENVEYCSNEGDVLRLNHRLEHSAENKGANARIHLIIDGVLNVVGQSRL